MTEPWEGNVTVLLVCGIICLREAMSRLDLLRAI